MPQISYIDPERFTIPPGPVCDPYWGAVEFLLEADTTITDGSSYSRAITVSGAVASTTQVKVGASSVFFDGVNDRISSSIPTAFGLADFTIEFWVYSSGAQGADWRGHLIDFRTTSIQSAIDLFWCYENTTNPISGAVVGGLNFYVNGAVTITSGVLAYNVWHHVALCRSNSLTRLFVNGLSVGSWIDTSNYSQTTFHVGGNYLNESQVNFYGYVDSLRITNGISRYFTNAPTDVISPPTAEYTSDGTTSLLIHPDTGRLDFSTVLLLPMDGANGSTTFTDYSPTPTTKSITRAGNTVISTAESKFGGASAYFDGSGDYLTSSTSSGYAYGTGDFTIELWFYALGSTNSAVQIDTRTAPTDGGGISVSSLAGPSGFVAVYVYPTPYYFNDLVPATSQWNHLAYVRQGGVLMAFLNGVKSASTYNVSTNFTSTNLTIGTNINNRLSNEQPEYYCHSYFDDLRITKGQALYTNNFSVPTSAFARSGTVTDSSSYNHTTTLPDAMITSLTDFYPIAGATRSLVFNGTTTYISMPDSEAFNLGAGDFTLECFVKPTTFTSPNTIQTLFGHWTPGTATNCSYYVGIKDGGALAFSYGVSSSNPQVTFGYLTLNQWNHVVVTRVGGVVVAYINGTLQPQKYYIPSTLNNCTGSFNVGRAGSSGVTNNFAGYLQEVRITKSAYAPLRSVDNYAPNLIVFPTVDCGNVFLVDDTTNDIPLTVEAETANVLYNQEATVYEVPLPTLSAVPSNVLYNQEATVYEVPLPTLSAVPTNVLYTGLGTNNDSYTVLLLPMDGVDGSTTFTDISSYNRTMTPSGNTRISTTQYKWNGSSGYFDGSGDKITTPYVSNQMDWWTSDYTIEAWVYPINLSTWSYTDGFNYVPSLIGNFVTGVGYAWGFGPIADGRVMFYYWNGTNNRLYSSTTISTNQWSHIALVVSGTTISIYINGVFNVSTTISGTPLNTTTLTIGEYAGNSINGYVDDIRISKGIARYTGNFSVPSISFSDTTYPVPLSLQANISGSGVAGAVAYSLTVSVAPISMSLNNTIDVYATAIATLPATSGEIIEYEVYATSVSTAPITIAL